MDCSSGEESDFSDSEILEYKDKPYEQLRKGILKVKYPNGVLRCPFCAGKKKQDFKYKDLHQHASGASKGSSNRNAKQKANHLALTLYLENELADEAEKPSKVATPVSEENDMFCWPWTGIVVNLVNDPDNGNDFENSDYWIKRFSKYKPEDVELLWDAEKRSAYVYVRFSNELIGFKNAMEFDKVFEADHHSKKEWSATENLSSSSIYAWLARADDFESQGLIGDYLRANRNLKTISDVEQEVVRTRNKAVVELASEIDMKNENLDDLQSKCNQKIMSLSSVLEEKKNMHQAYHEARREMQRHAQMRIKSVLDEREKMVADVEELRKNHESRSKEVSKKIARTERDKQQLEEEKRKNDMRNSSLRMASIEQEKSDVDFLRLVEVQKREKEEALKKVLELERQLDTKQGLEMELGELKWKLQVMKHLANEDDTSVKEQIKKMNDELEAKTEEMDAVEDMNQTLAVKGRQSNDELQEARKELIKYFRGLKDIYGGSTIIGLKRMGDIDTKAFNDACNKKFNSEEAPTQAAELCSLWQEKLKNPEWHPLKVVAVDGGHKEKLKNPEWHPLKFVEVDGGHKELINEDDELLKTLKAEWGSGIFDAVVTAFKEMNEYNPSGRYVINELWNNKENRKASSKEVISFIFNSLKNQKRKRGQGFYLQQFEEPKARKRTR